jgi:hypothetical protein
MLEDTAVIMCFFNQAEMLRIKAAYEALRGVTQLNGDFNFIFVEMTFSPDAQVFHKITEKWSGKKMQYTCTEAKDENRYLFQKEALLNQAIQTYDYDHYILIDADVRTEDLDCFLKIRRLLEEHPNGFISGYSTAKDTVDDKLTWNSAVKFINERVPAWNPGICVGITKKRWREIGGLNPYQILGGGDSVYMVESLGFDLCPFAEMFRKVPWSRMILRPIPRADVARHVDSHFTHFHHGSWASRLYTEKMWMVQKALDLAEERLQDVIELRDGLLAWKKDCLLRRVLMTSIPWEKIDYQAKIEEMWTEFSRT